MDIEKLRVADLKARLAAGGDVQDLLAAMKEDGRVSVRKLAAAYMRQKIREEAERDKTYSKTAEEDGTYSYGENYEAKELSTGKKVFYGVLRVVTIPLRRFL